MPARKLTGEGLDMHPSDNIEMLRALGRDPLVIKETRVDVLYGVANLMDMTRDPLDYPDERTLLLFGSRDNIIPREPACEWLRSLTDNGSMRADILVYANGYHMLTRDLQADVVLGDIENWIDSGPGQSIKHGGLVPWTDFCKDQREMKVTDAGCPGPRDASPSIPRH